MRKALFALVLVGAAFGGGAAINGPGLAWLKSTLLASIRDRLRPTGHADDRAPIVREPELPEGLRAPKLVARTNPTDAGPGVAPEPRAVPGPPAALPSSAIEVSPPPPRSEASGLGRDRPGPIEPPADPGPATLDPAVRPATGGDWSEIRRRLRELGVARYEVESEVGGRSRFRCLVPLAGRRAVGQQFEGEGDDDFQAAEAALRRLTLWRATETAP